MGLGTSVGLCPPWGSKASPYLSARRIAQELINPTRHWYVVVLGDSRLASHEPIAGTNATHIALTGCISDGNETSALTAGGACATSVTAASGNTASVSAYGLGDITWNPTYHVESRFNGANTGGPHMANRRIATFGMSAATHPLVFARWTAAGRAVRLRTMAWRHAGAINPTPGLSLFHAMNASWAVAPPNYLGSEVTNLTGSGYAEVSATVPAGHDWATNNIAKAHVEASSVAATTNLQTLSFHRPWYELDGPGITMINHAVGGCAVERFLDPAVTGNELWSASGFYPLLGDNVMLWVDLGTAAVGDRTTAAHAANIQALIARHRAAFPFAPVIISSAYESSISGSNPYWRSGDALAAANTPGSLYLDTLAACGTYAEELAAGYMDGVDTVHRTASGNAALWATIDSMVVAIAA